MNSIDLKAMRDKLGLFGVFAIVWLILAVIVIVLTLEVDKNKAELEEHLSQGLMHDAVSHFEDILLTRSWNASYGGVYVKSKDGIKPNVYLHNNVMHSDKNETLIKINPAWMTRQISELSNKKAKYYYKMVSLKPINPINKAEGFEKEALEYFEKNKDEPYYTSFKESGNGVKNFNFVGSLKVKQECMQCHKEQGYKVGDIRGGIRVTLPLENYNQKIEIIEKQSFHNKSLIAIFGFIIGILISIYLRMIFYHQKEIEKLNEELEKKVAIRTQELQDINNTLEQRVADEVEKNRKKDETMLSQSRYVAMGEIIEMISHQWRQPISVIGAITSNMLVSIELGIDDDKNKMKEELEKLSDQIQKLSTIITDFSNLFENESEEISLNPSAIVEEILNVMDSSFKHHNIKIETNYENKSELLLMSRELFQVYWNIINNAKEILVERNISNPRITVSIEESEGEVITYISDNGGGIDEKYIDKIFDPYFSTKDDLNGKGLGLYIAKSIVHKKMNASIAVENGDEGAIFTIRIPKKS